MTRHAWLIAVANISWGMANLAAAETLSFQNVQVGQLPPGWVAAKTGHGPENVWKVVEDQTAPGGSKVLAQTSSEGRGSVFNLCVAERTSYADVDLSTSFKAVAGDGDQGGGLIWRYQDLDNYYVVRMNPIEENYRVYKVVGGRRKQLGSSDVKIPTGTWHTLRVVHEGNRIQCYVDGKEYLNVSDDTIKAGGKIGLWTKADAQTRFTDVKVSGK